MSKFMNTRESGTNIRRRLLATVSAMALLGSVTARAADAGRPQFWIELGGQLSRLDDSLEPFAPAIMAARPPVFAPSQEFERSPLYSFDDNGSLSFQPEDSDWIFSASIRYGRSAAKRHVHQQTNAQPAVVYVGTHRYAKYPWAKRFSDTNAETSEHHLILDFQAGKDVGLGLFGGSGSSIVNLGVRFAQFSAMSNVALKSDPDWQFGYKYLPWIRKNIPLYQPYHSNAASFHATRSFHAVGPSISWNGSMPLAGNPQSSELSLDLGINAALLFGRQRAKVHHQATAEYHPAKAYYINCKGCRYVTYQPAPVNLVREKAVAAPNVGAFAGASFRMEDFKMSLGYRADFFIGAIDGGIDTRKSENRGFFGPFASISVGIGD